MSGAKRKSPSSPPPSLSLPSKKKQKENTAIRGNNPRGVKGRRESDFPREPHDHYVEAPWASRRLLEVLVAEAGPEPPLILDPAAGFGNVVKSARDLGLRAIGTDLIKRAGAVRGGRDFLSARYRAPAAGPGGLWIVTNPPFDQIREFTEKALGLARGEVAILAPTARLNAMYWLERLPLARVLYLTPRPSMWPGYIHAAKVAAGERLGNGRADFCWLIFETGGDYRGVAGWLRRDGGGA